MFAPSIGSTDGHVEITTVSGPYRTDRATRYSLRLDHKRCLADVASYFGQGLHFVGYWHTHPDPSPTLSGIDRRALARNLRGGGLEIERMIAVIIGNRTVDSSTRAYLIDKGPPVQLDFRP
jgi:proteasome lid subunit RPN8/RPN11